MVGSRRFRFGLLLGKITDRAAWLETLRQAEDSGFDILLQGDHLGPGAAPMPALAMAAEATSLRVGSLVLANDYRHPAIVAKDAATIDLLSGGRFELGIGAGWIEDHYRSAGIPFDPPVTRVSRLEEAIQVIKGYWSGAPFEFKGDHYTVAMTGRPRPAQQPHPPLLIAGSGPRLLRLAGRHADIVGITATVGQSGFAGFGTALVEAGRRIDSQLRWIREGANVRFGQLELNVLVHQVTLTDDVSAGAELIAEEYGGRPESVLDSPHVLLGTEAEMRDTLIERRERYGVSYIVFPPYAVTAVGGIVSQLAGA